VIRDIQHDDSFRCHTSGTAIMLFGLITRILAYNNRRQAKRKLGHFSISDDRLFRGHAVAAGDGWVRLETCSIVVGQGSLVLATVSFERDGAFLRVGSNSFIGASELIISTGITIGDNVLIASGCMIQDHDSHSIEAAIRRDDVKAWVEGRPKDWSTVKCQQIVIEEDVWVGARAIVLKGVRIGRGSIVGAGAVVTRDVTPLTRVVGNPARAVGGLLDQ